MATYEEVARKAREWDEARRKVQRKAVKRANYTARAKQRIAIGQHPLGMTPLLRGPNDDGTAPERPETCGNCIHLVPRGHRAGRYLKCEFFVTNSEATDARRWWPACIKWASKVSS